MQLSQVRDRKEVKDLNILKLKAAMVERGMSTADLADRIGINRATLYRKIAAQGEGFTIGEAEAITSALHLSAAESTAIFFGPSVAYNATDSEKEGTTK